MPKNLIGRCQPESIKEFRASAQQRLVDGVIAASANRRTAAIYLWGYAAEMTVKAAYFTSVMGYSESRNITITDLHAAVHRGITLGIHWPQQARLHNVRAWAELLVSLRTSTPGLTYNPPRFGNSIMRRCYRIERLWSPLLRYHKNVAYRFEVEQVRESAEWLLLNTKIL
jgi:hypothetical protein